MGGKGCGGYRVGSGGKPKEITWRINENGCWICTSHIPTIGTGDGYPRISIKNKKKKIARLFYEKYKGNILSSLFVCHSCDEKLCINPEHLWLGSPADNSKDMVLKNRSGKGEKNACAKLNENQIVEIRQSKGFQYEIAKKYLITQSCVSLIKRKKLWAHVA